MNDRRPIDGPRLGRLLWLAAVVVACLACLASAPSARAAVPFNGGPDVYPLYVPNDHTPVAIHFTATGLPDTTKYRPSHLVGLIRPVTVRDSPRGENERNQSEVPEA